MHHFSLRAGSLVGTENASRREEWNEENGFSPSAFRVFLCLQALTSEPVRKLASFGFTCSE